MLLDWLVWIDWFPFTHRKQASDFRCCASQEFLDKLGVRDEVVAQCTSLGILKDGYRGEVMLMETVEADGSQILTNNTGEWIDVEFEVALDSGSQDRVCDESDTPGYMLQQSPGSSRGQCFIVGDGGRLPNLGQKNLHLEPPQGSQDMASVFQIAKVTRPLMSVGRICDNGLTVTFDDTSAKIMKGDVAICVFER